MLMRLFLYSALAFSLFALRYQAGVIEQQKQLIREMVTDGRCISLPRLSVRIAKPR